MVRDDVGERVRNHIRQRFMIGMAGDAVLDPDSLKERGIIDSTGVLELVGFPGETFGLRKTEVKK